MMDQLEKGQRRARGRGGAAAGGAAGGSDTGGGAGAAAPRSGGTRPARAARAAPWPVGMRRGVHAEGGSALVEGPVPAVPIFGVERRLVRRAEAVWDELRPASGLPPAGAIHALETPLFADNSVLFALPPHPSEPGCTLPRILRVGRKLAELGIVHQGPVSADGSARADVAARLAALVERACAQQEPVEVEIDAPDRDRPGVLLRAIALPFAAPAGVAAPAGSLALVIASWRTLLSDAEAADLQRELAEALAWLRGTH